MQGEASGSPQLLQIFVETCRQVSSQISGDPAGFLVFQWFHLHEYNNIIAERLSARQLILLWISFCVGMFVCPSRLS